MKAGFIGLGAMGAPMAANLARAGLLGVVWNRTAGVADRVAGELGVPMAETIADLAGQVDVVQVCVSADSDVLSVMEALWPALTPGQIVVDHSTVSAETARRAAALVRAAGAEFLDAPVSGGVEGARGGTLAVMVGGREEALNRILPLLDAIASRVVRMGEVGAGQATKAVNQIMAAGINQAVAEALAFGEAQGLDLERVIDVVGGGAAGNWFLNRRGATMVRGVYDPGFKLALHHKDLQICMRMAQGLGVSLPITEKTAGDYIHLMERGFGDEDISALYRLKRPSR